MIVDWVIKAKAFEAEAHKILAGHESAPSRTIILHKTYERLNGLSLKQDDLFRQALRCLEEGLYRAAHVMAWAAFMDFFEEKISEDGLVKIHTNYPSWSVHKTLDELRE